MSKRIFMSQNVQLIKGIDTVIQRERERVRAAVTIVEGESKAFNPGGITDFIRWKLLLRVKERKRQ
jgi:hypothetical protein